MIIIFFELSYNYLINIYIIFKYVGYIVTYHKEKWCYEFPAYSPVDAGSESDHVLDVGAKSVCSIDPTDRDCFCQNGEQHRVSGRISIQQVEKVKPALY